MSFLKPITDRWVDLREKAATLLARLRPGKSGVNAQPNEAKSTHASLAFTDPTKALFPGSTITDEPQGSLPLSALLEASAHNIVMREGELEKQTNILVARIADRAQGEITLATQAIRFLIGLVWLFTAMWLYFASTSVMIAPAGMSVEDAGVLAKSFFTISAAGLGVAMAVAAIVGATGNGDNKKVRSDANDLGLFIAGTAQDFDHDLTRLREEMNQRPNPADAVIDLSRAHLTALEATAYFRKISFVTGTEGEDAMLRFRKFLRRPSKASAMEGFIIGLVTGALIISFFFVSRPEVPAGTGTLPDIAKYPWASNLLFFGGLLYAFVGIFLSMIGGALGSAAASKARTEALDALRGAFTAREAPRPNDVIRRIEDAVEVFRARVGRSSARNLSSSHSDSRAGSYAQEANFASDTGDSDIPAWRKRDSSVKFVDTNFQAAPESWRTDAYAKKFEADQTGKTGSKRSLAKLKNPPRD